MCRSCTTLSKLKGLRKKVQMMSVGKYFILRSGKYVLLPIDAVLM